MTDDITTALEGWKCPGCGRCYAPWMAMCSYCQPLTITAQNSSNRCTCDGRGGVTTAGPCPVHGGTMRHD